MNDHLIIKSNLLNNTKPQKNRGFELMIHEYTQEEPSKNKSHYEKGVIIDKILRIFKIEIHFKIKISP
jgi:hypothetical protein